LSFSAKSSIKLLVLEGLYSPAFFIFPCVCLVPWSCIIGWLVWGS
jgi:hypothetical protein